MQQQVKYTGMKTRPVFLQLQQTCNGNDFFRVRFQALLIKRDEVMQP